MPKWLGETEGELADVEVVTDFGEEWFPLPQEAKTIPKLRNSAVTGKLLYLDLGFEQSKELLT